MPYQSRAETSKRGSSARLGSVLLYPDQTALSSISRPVLYESPLKPQKRFILIGSNSSKTKEHLDRDALLCWQLPIFPGRRQPSIFGTTELNFCVRNGNRWTLCVNVTNLLNLQDRVSIENRISKVSAYSNSFFQEPCSSSIRSISIGQLNALLRLHLRPIKLVVCK